MKSLKIRILIFISVIIISFTLAAISISAIGMSSLASRVSHSALVMKLNGDVESLKIAFDSRFGGAELKQRSSHSRKRLSSALARQK